jgi:TRAP-type C4-dicarboxylate transport system permease small subunit
MKNKRRSVLDLINQAGIMISFTAMIMAVLIQVYARFFLDSAPSWTEELARVFFVYSVAFGAGLAVKEGAYIFLDSLIRWFNPDQRNAIELLSKIAILLVSLVMLWHSFEFMAIGTMETSPALHINMGYAFASMPIMAVMICFYILIDLLHRIKVRK